MPEGMERRNEKNVVGTGPSHKPHPRRRTQAHCTRIGEAMRPAAEAYGKTMNRLINEYMAGASKDPLDDTARANLITQDQRESETNRRIHRTMKECI